MNETHWLDAPARAHAAALQGCIEKQSTALWQISEWLIAAYRAGNKLLICGNGGSACDAMHIAGEFVGRFTRERAGLPAIALSADTSILTAVANDYGFEQVFSRQVEAYGQSGDLLIAISTSGRSPNILKALEMARDRGLKTILFTGNRGAGMTHVADQVIAVPSDVTAHIQEVHIFLLHTLADRVEAVLAGVTQ